MGSNPVEAPKNWELRGSFSGETARKPGKGWENGDYAEDRLDYQPLFGKWARAPPPKRRLDAWTSAEARLLKSCGYKLFAVACDRFLGEIL